MTPRVHLLVGRLVSWLFSQLVEVQLVGWSDRGMVCHNFLKGEVTHAPIRALVFQSWK